MNDISVRQDWIKILSNSQYENIAQLWQQTGIKADYQTIREPEIGLVQIQGRIHGKGKRFYIGDATITRCVIKLDNNHYGYSYLLGRDKTKSILCAVIDGLLQSENYKEQIINTVIEPLREIYLNIRKHNHDMTQTTKVDFFTLVRGEDE